MFNLILGEQTIKLFNSVSPHEGILKANYYSLFSLCKACDPIEAFFFLLNNFEVISSELNI